MSDDHEMELPPAGTAKTHVRGSSLLLAGRLIALCINFATQVLLVRLLAKSDYGAFAYALSLTLLGSEIARGGLDRAVSRFLPIYRERGDIPRIFGALTLVMGCIAALGGLLVVLVFSLQAVLAERLISSPIAVSLVLMLVFLAPIEALENVLEKLFAVFAQPRALFFRRHLLGPALKFAAVLSLLAFPDDVFALAWAYLVARICGTVVSVVMLTRILKSQGLLKRFSWQSTVIPVRELVGFSMPLLATDVAFVMRTTLVTFLLELFHSTVAVASFRAVLPVARLNQLVTDTFKLLFTPTAARLFAHDDRDGISQLYWSNAMWIAVLTFPIFATSFCLSEPLVVLLFGQQYADSGMILSLLSLGFFINASFGFNALTLRVFGRVREIFVIDIATGIIAVVLNFLLIPRLGAVGGATATCATLCAQNLMSQVVLLRTGAVSAIPAKCVRTYATIVIAAAILALIQWTVNPAIYVGLGLAATVSLCVLALNRNTLEIRSTFPELLRFAPVRKLLGCPEV